jgi:hypothetical protein
MNTMSDIPLKQCTGCKQLFPATLEFFQHSPVGKGKLTSRCKQCISAYYRSRHPMKHPEPVPEWQQGKRQCLTCKQWNPATTEFFHCLNSKQGTLHPRCKDCKNSTNLHNQRRTIPDGHKQCTRCKEILPFASFYPSKRDKFASQCVTCIKQTQQEKVGILPAAGTVKRCSICRQEKPATLGYFTSDKSKSDHLATKCKECRSKIRKSIPRTEEYYRKKREQWKRSYHKSERMKTQASLYGRLRHIRKAQVKGTYTVAQIQEQLKRQKYKCYYGACGFAKFKKDSTKPYGYDCHIEHTYPISRISGTGIPGNDISYLVLACPRCNEMKFNKFPWEFYEGGRLL